MEYFVFSSGLLRGEGKGWSRTRNFLEVPEMEILIFGNMEGTLLILSSNVLSTNTSRKHAVLTRANSKPVFKRSLKVSILKPFPK